MHLKISTISKQDNAIANLTAFIRNSLKFTNEELVLKSIFVNTAHNLNFYLKKKYTHADA